MRVFNRILKQMVLETRELGWLDFYDDLLAPAEPSVMEAELGNDFSLPLLLQNGGPYLKSELELDGTHVSPRAYIPLVERAVNQAMAQPYQPQPLPAASDDEECEEY